MTGQWAPTPQGVAPELNGNQLTGIYTFATLPTASNYPNGTYATTSDQGLCCVLAGTWVAESSSTGTVTSVGISSSTLSLSGTNPITGSGTIDIELPTTGSAPSFKSSVTATLATSQNNYSPTGYSGGVTNRILLAAASGGSTITGLVAATDGWTVYVRNTSTTDNITFSHLSGSSTATNQFSCPQGVSAILAPLTGLLLVYVTNVWTFA